MAKKRGKKNKKGKNVANLSSIIKNVKSKVKREKALVPGPTHADPSEATTSDPNQDVGLSRGIEKVKFKVEREKSLVPGPTHADPSEATTSDPNQDVGQSRGIEKDKGRQKPIPGFIFMCNSETKLECFQYRVFGLPMGQKEVVKEIKPGAKLFLFDFESKLLYGIYMATSAGQVKLEPAAFGGKYPAQVKFKIFKECLPLPENSLKHIIKENYNGSKFKQELSGKLVRKLVSSFQPLMAPLSRVVYQAPPNVSHAMLPPAREIQSNHTLSFHPMRASYLTQPRYGPPPVQSAHILQQGNHIPESDGTRVHTAVDHRSLPATVGYYVAVSQRPFLAQGIAQEVPYPRHRIIEERLPFDQVTNMYHPLPPPQREPVYRNDAAGYSSYRHSASTKYSLNLQVGSSAPYSSTTPVMQVQHPAAHGRPQGSLTYYSYARPNR